MLREEHVSVTSRSLRKLWQTNRPTIQYCLSVFENKFCVKKVVKNYARQHSSALNNMLNRDSNNMLKPLCTEAASSDVFFRPLASLLRYPLPHSLTHWILEQPRRRDPKVCYAPKGSSDLGELVLGIMILIPCYFS